MPDSRHAAFAAMMMRHYAAMRAITFAIRYLMLSLLICYDYAMPSLTLFAAAERCRHAADFHTPRYAIRHCRHAAAMPCR